MTKSGHSGIGGASAAATAGADRRGGGAAVPVSVLLVDDHAVVREGYKRLLEKRGDIAVIGEAANATDAYELFCKLAPQVVVMDIALPGVSGIDAMRRMLAREPQTRVLIFSMYEDAIFANRSLRAGACGYVTKASAPNVLVEAVHAVTHGKRYISADIAQSMGLNPKTVANHQSAIKQKLGADTAVQLLRIAESLGLDPDKPT